MPLVEMDIAYDRYSMVIDGRREFIRSGAMHYFRLPSQELWYDRLFKLKAAGYNTVDLYFCWGYHSPEQGVYNFDGIRDVRKLLQMTEELGLWVLARPGPYINAEYTGGGFPGWLLAKKHLPLRNRREGAFEWSDEYMGYVREWWEQIIPIINDAPNVLMVQIENEYATLEVEPDYMQAMYAMTREMGVPAHVPLFHNDLYIAGLYEDIVDIYSFDNYSVTQFETNWREMPEIFQVLDNVENNLRPFCQNRPLMAAELQAGWYGTWKGYPYEQITEGLGRDHIAISTKSLVGQGLTVFNHYKAIGGTNWNHTGAIETYTSYDFGAPISEAGINTERLFEAKSLNYFLSSFDIVATDRIEDPSLVLSAPEHLYAVRKPVEQPEARWIFLRNLTWNEKSLTLNGDIPVELHAFDVQILPYNMPLKCGYTLAASSVEAVYQNESLLVLKGDRKGYVKLTGDSSDELAVDASDNDDGIASACDGNCITLRFEALPDDGYRFVKVGRLSVLILGKTLIDTLWVQEDGYLVCGPEERLPKQQYGLAQGNHRLYIIDPKGREVQEERLREGVVNHVPALSHWAVYDEAEELSGGGEFTPVAAESADFDANRLYEGSAWYRYSLNGGKPESIQVDARHIWGAFLNGELIGHGQQLLLIHGLEAPEPQKLAVPDHLWKDGDNLLTIFVDGLGHPKGFHDDGQLSEGLLRLLIDGEDVATQTEIAPHFTGSNAETPILPPPVTGSERLKTPIARLVTEFTLETPENADVPYLLQLRDLEYERVNIYLNGILIGRHWRDCARQTVYHLPNGILNNGANRLELVVFNFDPFITLAQCAPNADQVGLVPAQVFTKVRVGAKL